VLSIIVWGLNIVLGLATVEISILGTEDDDTVKQAKEDRQDALRRLGMPAYDRASADHLRAPFERSGRL
jgi:hypothetical protein